METCSCAHEQQTRHLKSRISQLERMLDKEQKRNALLSSPHIPAPNQFPRATIPLSSPPPTIVDVKKSDEYRALSAELESERRIKADLLANLKELTNANEKSKAILVQELDEAKNGRDAALGELDELQEAFESEQSIFCIRKSQAIYTLIDPPRQDLERIDHIVDNRLGPESLRSFLQHIHESYNQQISSLLTSVGQQIAPSGSEMIASEVPSMLVPMLYRLIQDSSARTISSAQINSLSSLLDAGTTPDTTTRNLDKTIEMVVQSVKSKVGILEREVAAQKTCLYRSVPTLWQDLFTLLNRSSSFTLPTEPAAFDDSAQSNYEAHLKSTGSSLSHTIKKYLSSHAKSRQKISYRNFIAGELALFLPTRNANSAAWAAFNVGAPHYFLNMDGVDTEGKDFLIGRIQEITERPGEPGVKKESPDDNQNGATNDPRKWWEVKILEKKKIAPAAGP